MDSPACHVIYVNRNVGQDRMIPADPNVFSSSGHSSTGSPQDGIRKEVQPLLDSFGDGAFQQVALISYFSTQADIPPSSRVFDRCRVH